MPIDNSCDPPLLTLINFLLLNWTQISTLTLIYLNLKLNLQRLLLSFKIFKQCPVQSLSFLSFPRSQYNQSAVSKRFLLAVSPLELLNSTDYEEKKGTARS